MVMRYDEIDFILQELDYKEEYVQKMFFVQRLKKVTAMYPLMTSRVLTNENRVEGQQCQCPFTSKVDGVQC